MHLPASIPQRTPFEVNASTSRAYDPHLLLRPRSGIPRARPGRTGFRPAEWQLRKKLLDIEALLGP